MSVANGTPALAKDTNCTPPASAADADTVIVVPGDACGGSWIETVGGVVSGAATMVMVAWSVPVLFAASRAVALTLIVVPGAASAGMSTVRR